MPAPTKKVKKVPVNLTFLPKNKDVIAKYIAGGNESLSAMAERLLLAEIANTRAQEAPRAEPKNKSA
jgi:hypothetical protein